MPPGFKEVCLEELGGGSSGSSSSAGKTPSLLDDLGSDGRTQLL